MKFEKIKPGMVLYDVRRHKMGNTTASTVSVYAVKVLEIDGRCAKVSWNGNSASRMTASELERLRPTSPILIDTWGGMGKRLATREEIKAHKEAQRSNNDHTKDTRADRMGD